MTNLSPLVVLIEDEALSLLLDEARQRDAAPAEVLTERLRMALPDALAEAARGLLADALPDAAADRVRHRVAPACAFRLVATETAEGSAASAREGSS